MLCLDLLHAWPVVSCRVWVCRAWRVHIVEVKQERARQEADQQQLAEQHHRQVLVRGLWEGLGQALALRRTAHQDAHRHFQLCRQRSVSGSVNRQLGSMLCPTMACHSAASMMWPCPQICT